MDEELKGTAAGSTGDSPDFIGDGDGEENSGVTEHARVLSNLLQSLDAGGGGPGPVDNMMKAMGKKPPLISVVDEHEHDEEDFGDGNI